MFMVQIIVYAGAIMTIILFILMFLNIKEENLPKEPKKNLYIIVGFILILPINYLIIKSISLLPDSNMNIVQENFGGIKEFGIKLYQEWLIPFELISILLLVALIGAVVLAKQRTIKKIKND
jgi:NADH-quinone oxidoreductase subunit J